MFSCSLIEESCTKEETNKDGYTLTFGGHCTFIWIAIHYVNKYLIEQNVNTSENVYMKLYDLWGI